MVFVFAWVLGNHDNRTEQNDTQSNNKTVTLRIDTEDFYT
jgi:hypothetical protein